MLSSFLPVLVALIFLFIPIGVVLFVKHRQRQMKHSPLCWQLLRSPGESLRKELDEKMWDVAGYLMALPLIPLMLYSTHLTQAHIEGKPVLFSLILIAAGLLLFLFVSFKTFSTFKKIWKLRLGYDAEVAMGQELDQLMRKGAVVFHDFPAEGFNIDHVLVATNGVFAIETKGRSKPNRNQGKEDASVVYDGKALSFPTWSENQPLEQARSQAIWLSKWLSNAVGEPVAVKPALALPGWFVDRKGRSDVLVISGRESEALLKAKHESLSSSLMQRIEHQLDQRCRDVEPSMFKKRTSISG